jgi:S-adenosylmethionine uptake transporter
MNISDNNLGAVLMMASMLCFTMNDVFIKLTDGAIPIGQLLFLRGATASVLVILLAMVLGGLHWSLSKRAWRLVILRSLTEVATAYFFLNALFNMPLANVTAILQALPLTVTLGAYLFFRDPVGWRRASAIAVGFAGMLLIVRPGPDGFSIFALYALCAVLLVTARDLITRELPKEVPSLTVTLCTSLTVTAAFGTLSATQSWVPMSSTYLALIAGSAVFIVGGYFFSVKVMRTGDISFIAPFRYTSLIFALILGFVVFGDWPTPLTLLGAAIVVGAGLFTFYREAQLSKS